MDLEPHFHDRETHIILEQHSNPATEHITAIEHTSASEHDPAIAHNQ